jgi:hypothetical protein
MTGADACYRMIEVIQPIPDTCSTCQKINYIEIREQKTRYIGDGNVHGVQLCMHSLFSSLVRDILACRLLKVNRQTDASRLHDVTCVGSSIVTVILCVY